MMQMSDGELNTLIDFDYDAFVQFMEDYTSNPFDIEE
jgi:hypothetical protein